MTDMNRRMFIGAIAAMAAGVKPVPVVGNRAGKCCTPPGVFPDSPLQAILEKCGKQQMDHEIGQAIQHWYRTMAIRDADNDVRWQILREKYGVQHG